MLDPCSKLSRDLYMNAVLIVNSHLWRNHPPIDLRPLRFTHRSLDVAIGSDSYVHTLTRRMAYSEATR